MFPASKRCKQIEYHREQELVLESEGDPDGGWVDTHHFSDSALLEEKVADMALEDKREEKSNDVGDDDDDDDEDDEEAADMEEFEESGMLEQDDPSAVQPPPPPPPTTATAAAAGGGVGDGGEILQTRTYDLHITYDKYYQTPRLWLTGYDENRQPLSVEEMYEDFSQDHANKTVTMEAHSNLSGPPNGFCSSLQTRRDNEEDLCGRHHLVSHHTGCTTLSPQALPCHCRLTSASRPGAHQRLCHVVAGMWLSISLHCLEGVPRTRASVASDCGKLWLNPPRRSVARLCVEDPRTRTTVAEQGTLDGRLRGRHTPNAEE
ncbi:hypothetical protein O3P69_019611 [Scylla paramamosain]|uniref:Ubiquitin-like-conjugating enzyme ATG3 n=1 Tax=Scylla paramamosain TaxID=85552 RepID=A0AAW0SX57_SCYPA